MSLDIDATRIQPKDNRRVSVYVQLHALERDPESTRGGGWYVGRFDFVKRRWWCCRGRFPGGYAWSKYVTHWRELPPVPGERPALSADDLALEAIAARPVPR